jgi:hypothetical protein
MAMHIGTTGVQFHNNNQKPLKCYILASDLKFLLLGIHSWEIIRIMKISDKMFSGLNCNAG